MGEPDIPLVFPHLPSHPDVKLEADFDEEDAELHNNDSKENNYQTSEKSERQLESQNDMISNDLYVLDDGADVSFNLDDDDEFAAFQRAVGILKVNLPERPKNTHRVGTCFNCGGAHTIAECNLPHDRRRVNKHRNVFSSTKKE